MMVRQELGLLLRGLRHLPHISSSTAAWCIGHGGSGGCGGAESSCSSNTSYNRRRRRRSSSSSSSEIGTSSLGLKPAHRVDIPRRSVFEVLAAARVLVSRRQVTTSSTPDNRKSTTPQSNSVEIFDRSVKTLHRDRASLLMNLEDPLLGEVAERLVDRLDDCKREFPVALNLFGALEHVRRRLRGRGRVSRLIQLDTSQEMLDCSMKLWEQERRTGGGPIVEELVSVVGDEECLPLESGSLDVVISCLGLHWVNDLPGVLAQCRMALKPDGLFLGVMFGGDTLKELRISCAIAELEREGGVSPRISPFAHVSDAGNLLTRTGFSLPTVDVDDITVSYPSAVELVEHLRMMGETNAVKARRPSLRRDTAMAAAAVYQSMFGLEDGTVPATYQLIYMAGWSPHDSQQRPKRRGSATVSFDDLTRTFTPSNDDTGSSKEREKGSE